jgi:preprotein translocase subunit SecY
MILSFMGNSTKPSTLAWRKVLELFSVQGTFYAIVYFLLIIGFAYFYATIQFNPVEMANNLRKNGGAIPGIRPGKPTSDFISKILSRITLLGALLLSVIAILPIIIGNVGEINISLGGTSMLIMVGVALDVVRSLESQMMMRHYKGFLD